MAQKNITFEGKEYLITKYENTRVFPFFGRKDDPNRIKYDFEYIEKEIPETEVIKRCILLGCYGISRNSLHEFKGKYYIKAPSKTPELLKRNLKNYKNVVTFIVERL